MLKLLVHDESAPKEQNFTFGRPRCWINSVGVGATVLAPNPTFLYQIWLLKCRISMLWGGICQENRDAVGGSSAQQEFPSCPTQNGSRYHFLSIDCHYQCPDINGPDGPAGKIGKYLRLVLFCVAVPPNRFNSYVTLDLYVSHELKGRASEIPNRVPVRHVSRYGNTDFQLQYTK